MPLLDALASNELVPGIPRVVQLAGRNVALFRIDDEIHALEDECPIDGRPLALGELVGNELRCEKHGGRYDVRTGRCLRGGEDVRRLHAREEQGRVLVQVERPLVEVEQARLVASVRTALIDNDHPRLARDCVRMLIAESDHVDVIRAAVRYGAERGAGGFNVALASCADFARVAPLYDGLERAVPLTQALVAVAQANRGRSQRPIPEMARGVLSGSAERRRTLFARLVEERRSDEAEAMLTGALYQGLALSEVQQWLLSAASAHLIDGGATLVHTIKALDLCELLGTRESIHLLPSLVPPISYGIRMDRVEPLRPVAARLDTLAEALRRYAAGAKPQLAETFDDAAVKTALLTGSPTAAFETVGSALAQGVPAARVALSVVLAAAERVLRFDDLVEWDQAADAGWADALRPFSYAVATFKAVKRWPSAETLRTVFYAAALVQGNADLDHKLRGPLPSIPASPMADEALGAVLAAIRARRPLEAASLAKAFVSRGHDTWALAESLARHCVEDGLPTHAQAEQGAATTIAAVDAWEAAEGHPDAILPLLVAVRFLASDSRQRWTQRHVHKAVARMQDKA